MVEMFSAAFVFAIVGGLLAALVGGGVAAKSAYSKRRADWNSKHPNAPGILNALSATADVAAMLRFGPGAFLRGAAAAWPAGWAKGKERAKRYEPEQPPAPERQPVDLTKKNQPSTNGGPPVPPTQNTAPPAQPGERPNLRVVPGGGGQEDSMIEINNVQDLVTIGKDAIKQAEAEVKDAEEAVGRAERRLKLTEARLEAATRKLPKNQLKYMEAMRDSQKAALAACKRRLAETNNALVQAKAWLEKVVKLHLALVGTAAGPMYN